MFLWSHRIAVSLFGIGLLGLLIRRNALVVLMCIELMLNAVNLLLIEVSIQRNVAEGMILFVFVITLAAAEAAVGLGIVLNLYRTRGSLDIDLFRKLRG